MATTTPTDVSLERVLALTKEHDVKFVDLQFTDLAGSVKNITGTGYRTPFGPQSRHLVRWFFD